MSCKTHLAQKGHITTDRKNCCTLHQLGVNYLKFPFLSYLFMYPYYLNITLTLNTLFISFTPFLLVLLTHLHTKIYLLNEKVHNSHLAILRIYSFVHKCNFSFPFFIHPLLPSFANIMFMYPSELKKVKRCACCA